MGWSTPRHWFNYMPLHWKTSFQKQSEEFLKNEIFCIRDEANESYKEFLSKTLTRFNSRQNEKSDLNISIIGLLIGFLFFKNHQFSLTEITQSLAKHWANSQASSNFFLGQSVGSAFYSVFPEDPQNYHLLMTGLIVLLGFGLLVYLMNNLLIYSQIKLGLYERRLLAIIDRMESEIFLKINDFSPTLNWDRTEIRETFQNQLKN